MRQRSSQLGSAFTLLEAMIVVLVVGVLAATAVPAVDMIAGMNRATASSEIVRSLELARARAMATGRPHGVAFSVNDQTMQAVWIASANAAPSASLAQNGETQSVVRFVSFGGVRLQSYVGGDGISGEGTVWFSNDGTPQSRSSGGAYLGGWTGDATVQVSGQASITVRRVTGLVQ